MTYQTNLNKIIKNLQANRAKDQKKKILKKNQKV